MAKKKSSGKTYTSKGERPNVTKSTLNGMKRGYKQSADRVLNQQKAVTAGKIVWDTIVNPNKNETNKPFIRVKRGGREYLKTRRGYMMNSNST